MLQHRWTTTDLRHMRELAAAGYTIPDAAAQLGLESTGLRWHAAMAGIRFAPARLQDIRAAAIHPAMADLAAVRVQQTIERLCACVRRLERVRHP